MTLRIKVKYKMFCKHDYDILDKTIMESAYEQASSKGPVRTSRMEIFFKKKLVIIMKCSKCKRTKVIVETNP